VSHQYGDERLVEWLRENQYHPRSPRHGSASCLFFLDDLLHESELFAEAAAEGRVVYQEDYTVGSGPSRWNTDLVVGPPAPDENVRVDADDERVITETEPEQIWLAIDAKSVMTEHGKARRNRQRDINSFADIMHRHHPGAITGGLVLINMADRFKSPLRDDDDITHHENIRKLVAETVDIFRDIDRADGEISPNVDGVGCVVVDHTNMDDGETTELVTDPPAPQADDIVNYRRFVGILSDTLESRFLTGDPPSFETEVGLLRHELNEQVVELAHAARMVGIRLDDGDLSESDVETLRRTTESIEEITSRIAKRYVDE